MEEVRAQLAASPVVHADETGARAAGKLHWVHEASTRTLALCRLHHKRGKDGIDALGVLPRVEGCGGLRWLPVEPLAKEPEHFR